MDAASLKEEYGKRLIFWGGGVDTQRTLPFGTQVRVPNPANNRSVTVRINDRGPFVHGRGIDLSRGAARAIGCIASGTCRVSMSVL